MLGPKLPAELVDDMKRTLDAGPQPAKPCEHPFTFECERCRERWMDLLEEGMAEVYREVMEEKK